MKLINLPDEAHQLRLTHGFFEDFDHFVDGDRWTMVDADSGASVAEDADGVGGVVLLTTGATDNNEAVLATSNELFKFASDKPLVAEARVQYAESNTDDANVLFGVMDAIGANSLQDGGAGPKASYSGAVFFKADGDTVWSVESSLAGAQTTTQLTATNSLDGAAKTAGGSSYQTLRIEVQPLAGSVADIMFYIDEILVAKHKGVSITSATEMMVGVAAKAGSANSEVVSVDYISAYQKR